MAKEIIVKIKVDDNDLSRAKDKEILLTEISNLPQADQQRIIAICQSPKALKSIANNWAMLKLKFS